MGEPDSLRPGTITMDSRVFRIEKTTYPTTFKRDYSIYGRSPHTDYDACPLSDSRRTFDDYNRGRDCSIFTKWSLEPRKKTGKINLDKKMDCDILVLVANYNKGVLCGYDSSFAC